MLLLLFSFLILSFLFSPAFHFIFPFFASFFKNLLSAVFLEIFLSDFCFQLPRVGRLRRDPRHHVASRTIVISTAKFRRWGRPIFGDYPCVVSDSILSCNFSGLCCCLCWCSHGLIWPVPVVLYLSWRGVRRFLRPFLRRWRGEVTRGGGVGRRRESAPQCRAPGSANLATAPGAPANFRRPLLPAKEKVAAVARFAIRLWSQENQKINKLKKKIIKKKKNKKWKQKNKQSKTKGETNRYEAQNSSIPPDCPTKRAPSLMIFISIWCCWMETQLKSGGNWSADADSATHSIRNVRNNAESNNVPEENQLRSAGLKPLN